MRVAFRSAHDLRTAQSPISSASRTNKSLSSRDLAIAHHACRRMARTAPDAVIGQHSAGCERFHVASGVQIATCKTDDFPEKWPNSTPSACPGSQKEKKISDAMQDSSRFFRGTSFALVTVALTISSPETQRLSPSKGRATCSVGSPPRSPLVARPFSFLGKRTLRCRGVGPSARSTRSKFCLAFISRNFC